MCGLRTLVALLAQAILYHDASTMRCSIVSSLSNEPKKSLPRCCLTFPSSSTHPFWQEKLFDRSYEKNGEGSDLRKLGFRGAEVNLELYWRFPQ